MPDLPPHLAAYEEPFTDDDLAVATAAVADGKPELVPEPVARWRVTDEGAAEWAAQKLCKLAAEEQARMAQADAWIASARAWLKAEVVPLQRSADYFERALQDYALRVREATDGKRKTITVLSATIGTTEHKAKAVVAEPVALVAWADADPARAAVVKREPQVMLTELRKVVAVAEAPTGRWVVHLDCPGANHGLTTVLTDCGGCGGSGKVPEHHGQGLTEWLGCPDCRALGVELPERLLCPDCGADSKVLGAWPEHAPLVVDKATGERVPGVTVKPAEVTATVRLHPPA